MTTNYGERPGMEAARPGWSVVRAGAQWRVTRWLRSEKRREYAGTFGTWREARDHMLAMNAQAARS